MSEVSISDVGLALLVLDQEKQRNDMEIDSIDDQIRALQDRQRMFHRRNEAIDETIRSVRSGCKI